MTMPRRQLVDVGVLPASLRILGGVRVAGGRIRAQSTSSSPSP